MTTAVVIVLAYLFIQLIRHPLPTFTHGTWGAGSGWRWTRWSRPLSPSRRSPRTTPATRAARQRPSTALFFGYGFTQILCYVIGLLALVTVARNPNDIYGAFIALPLGAIAFGILAVRELDQSFANVYSTAASTQNLRPLWDRRVLAIAISALATAGALWLNIGDYENFLILLGSVFVPMSAVLIIDFFVLAKGHWDTLGDGADPLADAAAVGRRVRHLPAHQPRLRLLVGIGVDLGRPRDRLHASQLDVRVDLLVCGRRRGHPLGRRRHARLARSARCPDRGEQHVTAA